MEIKSPPPPPPVSIKNPISNVTQTTASSSGSAGIRFGEIKLKPTETRETKLPSKVTNVLLITKNWTSYNWFSPGIKLVLITSKQGNEERLKYGSENALKSYTHVEPVEDYDSPLVEWIAINLHKTYRFTHVIILSENDLIRGARIRQLLGITTGQSVENALRYRDKVIMKDTLKSLGIDVPIYSQVESASDIISFVQRHGYPVVVKPKLGYSSVNTTVIKSEQDMIQFISHSLKLPGIDPIYGLEVEKFVNGPMFHIDGLVLDGKVVLSWPSKYIGTVVQFRENRYIAGYGLSHDNPLVKSLNEYIESVIKGLGSAPYSNPDNFPFHAEAWVTPTNEIVLCEIASRGGGGNIKKEIQELFKVNLDEIWVQAQCNDSFPDEFEKDLKKFKTWHNFLPKVDYLVAWSYIYPKSGKVVSFPKKDDSTNQIVPALPPYCIHWQTYLAEGQIFNGPQDCADTVVACLVKGENEAEVISNLDKICDWFFSNSVWEAL